jgi:hypothetical protein
LSEYSYHVPDLTITGGDWKTDWLVGGFVDFKGVGVVGGGVTE